MSDEDEKRAIFGILKPGMCVCASVVIKVDFKIINDNFN